MSSQALICIVVLRYFHMTKERFYLGHPVANYSNASFRLGCVTAEGLLLHYRCLSYITGIPELRLLTESVNEPPASLFLPRFGEIFFSYQLSDIR